jgi:DNA-binding transcriptional MerR regulator
VIGALLWALMLTMSPLERVYCLTAEEIAYLKKAGVSEETIRLMIEEENRQEQTSQTGIWEVEDEKGRPSTLYRVGGDEDDAERKQVEQEKVDRAWEMLRNLVIDARENP